MGLPAVLPPRDTRTFPTVWRLQHPPASASASASAHNEAVTADTKHAHVNVDVNGRTKKDGLAGMSERERTIITTLAWHVASCNKKQKRTKTHTFSSRAHVECGGRGGSLYALAAFLSSMYAVSVSKSRTFSGCFLANALFTVTWGGGR